jgi:hypothetical protein
VLGHPLPPALPALPAPPVDGQMLQQVLAWLSAIREALVTSPLHRGLRGPADA